MDGSHPDCADGLGHTLHRNGLHHDFNAGHLLCGFTP